MLAAADLLSTAVAVFRDEGVGAIEYRFGAGAYPEMIRAGAFVVQYGHCVTYRAFKFLMERLLGGVSRPFIPSVFLALAAHPALASPVRPEEIEDALLEREQGWGTFDCAFRPTRSFPEEQIGQ